MMLRRTRVRLCVPTKDGTKEVRKVLSWCCALVSLHKNRIARLNTHQTVTKLNFDEYSLSYAFVCTTAGGAFKT